MGKVKRGITVVSVAVCAFAGAADKTLFRDDFDGDLSHWRGLGGGWSVEAGVGADGSRALVWRTSKDGKKPSLLQYPLTAFRPGMTCRETFVNHSAFGQECHIRAIRRAECLFQRVAVAICPI